MTSKLFATSAIEMYVRRSVWGVVSGSGGRPWPSRRSVAAAAASRTIAPIRWRVLRLPREFGNA